MKLEKYDEIQMPPSSVSYVDHSLKFMFEFNVGSL